MKLNKLFTTLAAGTLMLTLAACGNDSATSDSNGSSDVASSKVTKKHHSNKDKVSVEEDSSKSNGSVKDSQNEATESSSKAGSSSSSAQNYKVSSTTTSSNGSSAKSSVKQSANAQQATMTATDARNIVKEHIGNQLNNRGVAGQSTDDLPSIDSVDGYTATQNGTNDWTVTGNGHTYHVTANSVTGK